MKDKNHLIILIEIIWQNQHPFLMKIPNKLVIEEIYIHIIKAIYDKITANLILNGEKL